MINNYLDNANVQIVCSLQDLRKVINECMAERDAAMKEPSEEHKDRMLTKKEVMERLQVKHVTLWRWVKLGYLRQFKVGNKVYFSELEIKRVMEESKK